MSSSSPTDSTSNSFSPPPLARPSLATLPPELKARLIKHARAQDDEFWERMEDSYGYITYKSQRALGKQDPAWWFGRSLLSLSCVSRDFAELSTKVIFKVIQSRRCTQPVFTYSILYKHAALFEHVNFGGKFDNHISRGPGGDHEDPNYWHWQDTKSVIRLFDLLPLLPSVRRLELGTTAAAVLFGLEDEVDNDEDLNNKPLPHQWAELEPSGTSQCNERREALALLAPRITDLALYHSDDERPGERDPDQDRHRTIRRNPLPTLILAVPLFAKNLTTLRLHFESWEMNYDHSLAIAQCHHLKKLYLINLWSKMTNEKVLVPLLRPKETSGKTGLDLIVPPVDMLFIDGVNHIYPIRLVRVFRRTFKSLFLNPHHNKNADISWPSPLMDLLAEGTVVEEPRENSGGNGPLFPVLERIEGAIATEVVPELFSDKHLGDVSASLRHVVLDWYRGRRGFSGSVTSREVIEEVCRDIRTTYAPLARVQVKLDPLLRGDKREMIRDVVVGAGPSFVAPPLVPRTWDYFPVVAHGLWFSGAATADEVPDVLVDSMALEMRKQLEWTTQRLERARLAMDKDAVKEVAQWLKKINVRYLVEMD
ncbi:hypothetical protein T439DRAFT_360487 [Meredithblackwellia eburnea MCA 4105]